MKISFIIILFFSVFLDNSLLSQVNQSTVKKEIYYKPTLNPNSNTIQHKGKFFHFEIENTFKKLQNLTIVLTDTKGNRQLFACCVDNGGLESSDDRGRINQLKEIIMGKNLLKINLEEYKLKDGEAYKMTIKGLQNDLFINFKYTSK
jgi:hypothetical protein